MTSESAAAPVPSDASGGGGGILIDFDPLSTTTSSTAPQTSPQVPVPAATSKPASNDLIDAFDPLAPAPTTQTVESSSSPPVQTTTAAAPAAANQTKPTGEHTPVERGEEK